MRHTARARSLARSTALRDLDEREREREEDGAGASSIMRVYAGKWCPIMLARGKLRHPGGLPRIPPEIMIDSRY